FISSSDFVLFFFSSRRRHTRFSREWSSDVCSSDLAAVLPRAGQRDLAVRDEVDRPGGAAPLRDRLAGGVLPLLEPPGERAEDLRSEERRVGKEWRSGWLRWHAKNRNGETTQLQRSR